MCARDKLCYYCDNIFVDCVAYIYTAAMHMFRIYIYMYKRSLICAHDVYYLLHKDGSKIRVATAR